MAVVGGGLSWAMGARKEMVDGGGRGGRGGLFDRWLRRFSGWDDELLCLEVPAHRNIRPALRLKSGYGEDMVELMVKAEGDQIWATMEVVGPEIWMGVVTPDLFDFVPGNAPPLTGGGWSPATNPP